MQYLKCLIAPRKVVDRLHAVPPLFNQKESYSMSRSRIISIVIALIAIIGVTSLTTSSAYARGQCGGSVTSWKGYYNNLQQKGVVSQAAKVNQSAGYSPIDGSFKEWLQERVIVSRLATAANVQNHGCNPGVLFGAGTKHLSKGWRVLVALPDKYSKDDIATKPRKGYKLERVRAKFVGQATCSNPGKNTVTVKLWVKKKRGPAKVTLQKRLQGGTYAGLFTFKVTMNGKTKTVKLKAGKKVSLGTMKNRCSTLKVTETNIPMHMAIVGPKTRMMKICASRTITITNLVQKPGQAAGVYCISTNSGNLSGVGAVQGSCNSVTVICQNQSCNPTTENVCPANASGGSANNGSIGGSANAEACKTENPPPCTVNCVPPQLTPPSCVGLIVTANNATTGLYGTGLGIDATVLFNPGDDTLIGANINWGDGTSTNSTSASHTYPRSGMYTVVGTVYFANAGGVTSVNCRQTISVNLTCPPGNTPNPEGSECVKDGATAPDPPAEAPGPNPSPSPEDPAPGGHACYSETTGLPVEPIIVAGETLCPPGSFGRPVAA